MADAKDLFQAATKGDSAAIRTLLAAGAPINATDPNRLTPVMRAAQAGQAEAFRTLVEHGADLGALGLDQVDLLECAAEGGDVGIITFLLKRGHPVEGHWTPRSKVAERMGHLTPLLMAAINARVDAVRVLLEAGANREATFDGQTALELVEADIRRPNDAEEIARVPFLNQIAALLAESPGARGPNQPGEIGIFTDNAKKPGHQQVRRLLTERCGPPRAWKPAPDHGLPATDVVAFTLRRCKKQEELEELQDAARTAGSHLVLAEPWAPGENAVLVLFPTADKFAVIAAVGTEGANDGVRTGDILAFLKCVDDVNPFHLVYCGHDLVGGAFLRAVKGAAKLARDMADLCPGADSSAAAIKSGRSFLLRWD